MITGAVTAEREAVVALPVSTAGTEPRGVDLVIDTGFTEFIALPSECIERLHLPLIGLQRMILADGSVATLSVYEAIVHWHGAALPIQALEIEGSALLGMALLQDSHLAMDVIVGGRVQIAPLPQS
ncbi:clan AA aspartic protease [bacterium]|nr:clan AA aspartic protease [bacterium]